MQNQTYSVVFLLALFCCAQGRRTGVAVKKTLDVGFIDSMNSTETAGFECCCKKYICKEAASLGDDHAKPVQHADTELHIPKEQSGKKKPMCCKRKASCDSMSGYKYKRVDAWCEKVDHNFPQLTPKASTTLQEKEMIQQMNSARIKFDGRRRSGIAQPIEWARMGKMLTSVRISLLEVDEALHEKCTTTTPGKEVCKPNSEGAVFRQCNAHNPDSTMRIRMSKDYDKLVDEASKVTPTVQQALQFVDFRGCFSSPSKDFQELDYPGVSSFVDRLEEASVWQNTAGQSGSAVLIFGKYVLKQVKPAEMETFAVVTHRGAAHWGLGADVETCGTGSLLTPFYWAMKRPEDEHWWVLMEKIGLHDQHETMWYDIKGAQWASIWDGKTMMNKQLGDGDIAKHKDLGFYSTVKKNPSKFELRQCDCDRLATMIQSDVTLLRHAGITDYSLFLKVYEPRSNDDSTCDPNTVPDSPSKMVLPEGECFRQFPAVLLTGGHSLAVGIVDFGERGWKSLPMSTMIEPQLYAKSFESMLTDYFNCKPSQALASQAVVKDEYMRAFPSGASAQDVKTICDCPVLIKEGGEADDDDSSMLVRVSSPDSEADDIFGCNDLTTYPHPRAKDSHGQEVQPQCFNSEGQYVGTMHKFLNDATSSTTNSKILCKYKDRNRMDQQVRLTFSVPFQSKESRSKPLRTVRAYWQLGSYGADRRCKPRRIPDNTQDAGKDKTPAFPKRSDWSVLKDSEDKGLVVKRGQLKKKTHDAITQWHSKDVSLSARPTKKPNIVLEYSEVGDTSNKKQTIFDVCNEIMDVKITDKTFVIYLNNRDAGHSEYSFYGDDVQDWVHNLLRAMGSCQKPCAGGDEYKHLEGCDGETSMHNTVPEDTQQEPEFPPLPPATNGGEWENGDVSPDPESTTQGEGEDEEDEEFFDPDNQS